MSKKEYIKDHMYAILMIVTLVLFIETFLLLFECNWFLIGTVPASILVTYSVILGIDYHRKKEFYDFIENTLMQLDKKYLFHELVTPPHFLEGKKLVEFFQEVDKKMIEDINMYKRLQAEYREYIELWVHEIKTPIASSKLIIENHSNEITQSIEEEIGKIDTFVEQALYYSRSNNVEKDYFIKRIELLSLVNSVIIKNKKEFISKRIKLELRDLDTVVYTDSKWLEYMLQQIIGNSVKYITCREGHIEIFTRTLKNRIELCIRDNGVGIEESDIARVFEKSFTGYNGRIFQQSTGMGLYLCKKLCDKLGLKIRIASQKETFTQVTIVFPKDNKIEEVQY